MDKSLTHFHVIIILVFLIALKAVSIFIILFKQYKMASINGNSASAVSSRRSQSIQLETLSRRRAAPVK